MVAAVRVIKRDEIGMNEAAMAYVIPKTSLKIESVAE